MSKLCILMGGAISYTVFGFVPTLIMGVSVILGLTISYYLECWFD